MKTIKNLLKMYSDYKARKLRLKSTELAVRCGEGSVVFTADKIYKFIKEGSQPQH